LSVPRYFQDRPSQFRPDHGQTFPADVIAVASMSLANPDLVERIKTKAPLNAPDPSTFYGGGTKGYTDYPTLAMTAHQ
jgi:2,4-dienoyl-CoA reductase-like NADH-dependent reductase (Old Yellow Enzyme family)